MNTVISATQFQIINLCFTLLFSFLLILIIPHVYADDNNTQLWASIAIKPMIKSKNEEAAIAPGQ